MNKNVVRYLTQEAIDELGYEDWRIITVWKQETPNLSPREPEKSNIQCIWYIDCTNDSGGHPRIHIECPSGVDEWWIKHEVQRQIRRIQENLTFQSVPPATDPLHKDEAPHPPEDFHLPESVQETKPDRNGKTFHLNPSFSFEGMPNRVSLPKVIEILSSTHRTGRLNLTYSGMSGYLDFNTGKLENAKCGNYEGPEAVYFAMSLADGAFLFEPNSVREGRNISEPWQKLVLEGFCRMKRSSISTIPETDPQPKSFFEIIEAIKNGLLNSVLRRGRKR